MQDSILFYKTKNLENVSLGATNCANGLYFIIILYDHLLKEQTTYYHQVYQEDLRAFGLH